MNMPIRFVNHSPFIQSTVENTEFIFRHKAQGLITELLLKASTVLRTCISCPNGVKLG